MSWCGKSGFAREFAATHDIQINDKAPNSGLRNVSQIWRTIGLMLCAMLLMIASESPTIPSAETPIPVKLVQDRGKWTLLRGGNPYYIKGAGGTERMSRLQEAGGNSVRTWGAERLRPELDEAQAHGLTMTVGIWLGHKRHGFDYNDARRVKEQFETAKRFVADYRTHPAVLFWALGNEMETDNDTPQTWKAVGEMAKMVNELDPHHPVMTVVAEISEQKIRNIQEYAHDVDVLGINSYGGLPTLPDRLAKAGWKKPYVVTEFGPIGPWEAGRTDWRAALEPTSTEKAKFYASNYQRSIAGQPGWCLGSYVFLWGEKQETTPTWFGMMLPSGEALGSVDVMQRVWTGKPAKNEAPFVQGLIFSGARKKVPGGSKLTAKLAATDPNSDPLSYRWELRREVAGERPTGEGETRPAVLEGIFSGKEGAEVSFAAPAEGGAYRLYAYVFDGKGKAATANEPFFVNP